jgi:diadenosine tetraphosphate (Ap4A) HIT family hydrolase
MIMRSCDFCKLIRDNKNPTWINELSVSIAIVNLDQSYLGRSLVIFKRHEEDILALSNKERDQFNADMIRVAQAIKKVFKPDLINYAILGNNQRHLHWHVIPRYRSDPNWGKPPWPHERKFLSPEQYYEIAIKIRNALKNS